MHRREVEVYVNDKTMKYDVSVPAAGNNPNIAPLDTVFEQAAIERAQEARLVRIGDKVSARVTDYLGDYNAHIEGSDA
jgi:hypothetical protein